MVIDFHTHAFPDELAPRALVSLTKHAGVNFSHDGTIAGLKRSMNQAGITHSVLCNIVVKPGQTPKIMAFSDSVMEQERSGQIPNIISLASVHPLEDGWRDWLARFKEAGYVGIKLHPDYQGFYIDDPRLEPFYREVARLGLLMLFHAGLDDGLPEPVHATPERIANVLPLLELGTTVLAHMGGYAMWGRVQELICGSNVWFDSSLEFHTIDMELKKSMFRKHSPDRILYGSDSPWNDQTFSLHYFREEFAKGFLSQEDTDKVLWRNGAQLLGLPIKTL